MERGAAELTLRDPSGGEKVAIFVKWLNTLRPRDIHHFIVRHVQTGNRGLAKRTVTA
jgi:hypothetical protein